MTGEKIITHRIEEVVKGGMCVGCGACSVATAGAIPITIGRRQSLTASLEGVAESDVRLASTVCPFSDESRNEDEIAALALPPGLHHDERLGAYSQIVAGRLTDEGQLVGSSSGGLTSWVAAKLLERGDVDGVIHVQPGDPLFSYQISDRPNAVLAARKSMYYSTSFAETLQAIRGNGRTYAFIGVPCFVRAARLLCENDEVLAGQLRFFLGLVCGHLKPFGFAESLAWQLGVKPDDLESVDFRVKVPDRASSNYDFSARARGAHELISKPAGSLVGGSWGHGAFQLNACNYCDDIFAETADVSFGDAWLAPYKQDWRGTNVVVSRNATVDEILADGARTGELTFESISTDKATATQAGNFRHRRDGLSVRLADDVASGLSVPTKRVAPGQRPVPRSRRRLIRLRRAMTEQSQMLYTQAKELDSLPHYLEGMALLIARYRRAERRSVPLWRRSKKLLPRLVGKRRRAVIT